ncbi:ATP-binding cassette domain-containing protein [Micromonospora sp. NPDC048843]|uniref:ATP-binding cassette domain-containing protein n=1 Tax=Micromonospora sp. NPDC048843 TaxID=3155389 RepID=UPI00340DF10B
MSELMIETCGLTRRFGSQHALNGIDVLLHRGKVLGLLGHNGAGKTTLVRILTTVLPPTSGTARVGGFDVVRDAREVRRIIGLTGQYASIDEQLSGYDNLVLIARLLGAGRTDARRRADELLQLFELSSAARRPSRTYSGGTRRRLDLAASLVGDPELLFLDEPTTGLDPVSRTGLWDLVGRRVQNGTTVLLTTQYLEEADRLADTITVLSDGRIVAAGTATQLKAQIGRRTVHVTLANTEQAQHAARRLQDTGRTAVVDPTGLGISTPVTRTADLVEVVRTVDEPTAEITEVSLTEPTLNDVYLAFARRDAEALTRR